MKLKTTFFIIRIFLRTYLTVNSFVVPDLGKNQNFFPVHKSSRPLHYTPLFLSHCLYLGPRGNGLPEQGHCCLLLSFTLGASARLWCFNGEATATSSSVVAITINMVWKTLSFLFSIYSPCQCPPTFIKYEMFLFYIVLAKFIKWISAARGFINRLMPALSQVSFTLTAGQWEPGFL